MQLRSVLVAFAGAACGTVNNGADPKPDAPPTGVDGGPDCATPPASLAHWWSGDGNANDSAGSLNGVAMGDVGFAAGRVGQAFSFEGQDDHVAVADLDALWPTGSFSIEAWFRTREGGIIIRKYECGLTCAPPPASSFYSLSVRDDGKLYWEVRDQSSELAPLALISSALVTDDAWHHAIGVFDRGNLKLRLYLDGAAMTVDLTADEAEGFANTDDEQDPVVIGAGYDSGMSTLEGFFTGLIDEVSFYDDALGSAEAAALYTAPAGKCRE